MIARGLLRPDHPEDDVYFSTVYRVEGDPLRTEDERGELIRRDLEGCVWDGDAVPNPRALELFSFPQGRFDGGAIDPERPSEKLGNPLTPAIVFKRPALPPASASPNTNLRNHRNKMRELVGGSPDKSLAMWPDTSFLDAKGWSPAVSIPNDEHVNLPFFNRLDKPVQQLSMVVSKVVLIQPFAQVPVRRVQNLHKYSSTDHSIGG